MESTSIAAQFNHEIDAIVDPYGISLILASICHIII